jgi:hypothetical protein
MIDPESGLQPRSAAAFTPALDGTGLAGFLTVDQIRVVLTGARTCGYIRIQALSSRQTAVSSMTMV